MRKQEFKYPNLTPTNTEFFCDKTPQLTDYAGGNCQVEENIDVIGNVPHRPFMIKPHTIVYLTDCAGGNYQVGNNIGVIRSGSYSPVLK